MPTQTLTTITARQARHQSTGLLPPRPAASPRPARRLSGIGVAASLPATAVAVAVAMLVAPAAVPSQTMAGAATIPPVTFKAPRQPGIVLSGLPQRAGKSDRLYRWPRAPKPAAVEDWRDSQVPGGPERDGAADTGLVSVPQPVDVATPAAAGPEPNEPERPAPADIGAEDSDAAMAATQPATVTVDVNMRAGPDNGATVITVVPASSHVEVIACTLWCEVVFDGERGWIYKSFVRNKSS